MTSLILESDLETGNPAHSSEPWLKVKVSPAWRDHQNRLLLLESAAARELAPGMRPATFNSHPRNNGLVNGLLRLIGEDHVHSFAASFSPPNGNLFCLSAMFRALDFLFRRLASVALIRDLLPASNPCDNRDHENQPLPNRVLVPPNPTSRLDLPRSHPGDDMKLNGYLSLCHMGMPVGMGWG